MKSVVKEVSGGSHNAAVAAVERVIKNTFLAQADLIILYYSWSRPKWGELLPYRVCVQTHTEELGGAINGANNKDNRVLNTYGWCTSVKWSIIVHRENVCCTGAFFANGERAYNNAWVGGVLWFPGRRAPYWCYERTQPVEKVAMPAVMMKASLSPQLPLAALQIKAHKYPFSSACRLRRPNYYYYCIRCVGVAAGVFAGILFFLLWEGKRCEGTFHHLHHGSQPK